MKIESQIDRELLEEILKTTNEMKEMRKKIISDAENLSQKLTKEIQELEQVPNPSEKLQKLIRSAKSLLKEINRIPKYCL